MSSAALAASATTVVAPVVPKQQPTFQRKSDENTPLKALFAARTCYTQR